MFNCHSPGSVCLAAFAISILGSSVAQAEDLPPATKATYVARSLEVPAFTPPAPVEPKVLPAVRADAVSTFSGKSDTSITIIRGEASTLPDPPPPPEPKPQLPALPLSEEKLVRIAWQRLHTFRLGGTIYDHRVSAVHWTHPVTGAPYQALCGFDIGLISGLGEFVHNDEKYRLHTMFSNISTATFRRLARAPVREIPSVSPDTILITKGDPNDPIGTSPITLIKQLIDSEKDRLIAHQAARQTYQRDYAIWAAAHPPVPRDEIILLRPHRGSRYLTNPTPEKDGGAK